MNHLRRCGGAAKSLIPGLTLGGWFPPVFALTPRVRLLSEAHFSCTRASKPSSRLPGRSHLHRHHGRQSEKSLLRTVSFVQKHTGVRMATPLPPDLLCPLDRRKSSKDCRSISDLDPSLLLCGASVRARLGRGEKGLSAPQCRRTAGRLVGLLRRRWEQLKRRRELRAICGEYKTRQGAYVRAT